MQIIASNRNPARQIIICVYLTYPSGKEPILLEKRGQKMEGDWTNLLSILFKRTNQIS